MATSTTNDNEWYTVDCGAFHYTLPVRYQDPAHIGQGAFGAVIRARDTVTGEYVAIKKMLRPFETPIHAQRTYRELKLLTYLNYPDAQIVQLYNVFTPEKNLNDFETVYFVFNFVDYNLHQVIHRSKPFEENYVMTIIYSLLRSLKFIHSAGIMHRDIKPQNVGMDKDSNVVILDFGLARGSENNDYTTYVATRWWRAPEVYINERQYRDKIDIWSVGCIMAEIIRRQTLFPGLDQIDQLNRIFDIIGTPDLGTLNELCTPEGTETPTSGVSPQGVALLDRLLSFDHRLRPTAEEALADPFSESLHDPEDEPTAQPFFDEHQGLAHSVATWKSIMWQMIQDFNPPTQITDNAADDS